MTVDADVAAHHRERAVREIDEVHEAHRHRQADADQEQQAAVGDAVEQHTEEVDDHRQRHAIGLPYRERPASRHLRPSNDRGPTPTLARMRSMGSAVEEHGLACALQDDVPAQRPGAAGDGHAISVSRRAAGTFAEHRIVGVRRIAGKIDARDELLQQPAHEDRHAEVRRLQCRRRRAGTRPGLIVVKRKPPSRRSARARIP